METIVVVALVWAAFGWKVALALYLGVFLGGVLSGRDYERMKREGLLK